MFNIFSKIIIEDKVQSTNETIKGIAQNNLFLIAKEQTSGKTAKKKVEWKSEKGNLYLSSSHKITKSLEKQIQTIGLIACYSAVEALKKRTKGKLQIESKWPNDIMIQGKKLGGILCERHENFLIIGIGLNLKKAPKKTFSGINGDISAGSLREFGYRLSPKKFTKLYRKELLKNIKILKRNGFEYFLTDMHLEANYFKLGQEISIKGMLRTLTGTFIGLDKNGFLLLDIEGNRKPTTIKTAEI
ncbi:MAG: biotin--[acetyl-CoA-carboxylase] ligase [Alphaproteobacteria bacterium]|jgi:BirA family biotin operon repressor/biotin-[acetyl-CoA-carboxylase] ligase|nr:biotin--[acetyl-CoA-carboxylase] ligase [Alphaproteobacteria bacterium]